MRLLAFLNLLDFQDKLSITNLAMYLILLKVSFSQLDWASAVALFTLCANYAHKRSVSSKVATQDTESEIEKAKAMIAETTKATSQQIEELRSVITTVAVKVGMK